VAWSKSCDSGAADKKKKGRDLRAALSLTANDWVSYSSRRVDPLPHELLLLLGAELQTVTFSPPAGAELGGEASVSRGFGAGGGEDDSLECPRGSRGSRCSE
jgi:hypothetical protein